MPMKTVSFITALCLCLVAPACVENRGPSNVSQGKQYVSGNSQYDEFFTAVHELQVSLGAAPDRELAIRQDLSEALDIDAGSRAEEIAEAMSKRVSHVGKRGTTITLTLSGMEEKGTPSSVLTTTGTISDEKDKAFVDAIEQAGKDATTLLGDVRRAAAATAHLRSEAPSLESGVDQTFGATGREKKSEVSKNLADAERMIPLMATRANEMEDRATELLHKLAKSLAAPASDEGAKPAMAAETGEHTKKKKEKGKGGHAETKAEGHPEPKAAAHAPPKAAEPKTHNEEEAPEPPKRPPPSQPHRLPTISSRKPTRRRSPRDPDQFTFLIAARN